LNSTKSESEIKFWSDFVTAAWAEFRAGNPREGEIGISAMIGPQADTLQGNKVG
jgi:hypothetical protein